MFALAFFACIALGSAGLAYLEHWQETAPAGSRRPRC